MAIEWIKIRVNICEEEEVVHIASALSLDRFSVVGRLFKIWSWADQHSISGNAMRVTCAFLDELVNCPGFAIAMRNAGWLEGRDSALSFPHFDRHNGQTAKKRALTCNRVTKYRNAECNSDGVTEALPEKKRKDTDTTPPTPSGEKGERGIEWQQSAEALITACGMAGIPPEFIRTIWLEHDASGVWKDYLGNPITNPRSYVKSRFNKQLSRKNERVSRIPFQEAPQIRLLPGPVPYEPKGLPPQ